MAEVLAAPEESVEGVLRPIQRSAPPEATSWLWEGRKLNAPGGNVFQTGIADPTDGSSLVLAWVLPPTNAGKTPDSGLWAFDARGAAVSQLVALPELLPSGADCRYEAALEATGARSVTSHLSVQCSQELLPGTPVRALHVVSTARDEPLLLSFVVQSEAPGERLKLVVDSSDRDGDEADDVALSVQLSSPTGQTASLPLRYLFRRAGASRENAEPRKTLAELASELSVSAVRKKDWGSVAPRVDALRRLLSSLCEELGAPRIQGGGGSGVDCGDIWPSLARLQYAATRALMNDGDRAAALGEAERADWFSHKPNEKEERALRQIIVEGLPSRAARKLARFEVELSRLAMPHRSPLHFSEDGQLWARFADGDVKRLTMRGDPPLAPGDGAENAPVIRAPVWDWIPRGPGGQQVSAVVASCERSEVQVAFSATGSGVFPPVPLSLLAPRPGNCRRFGSFEFAPELVTWVDGHPLLLVGGQLHHPTGKTRPSYPVSWSTRFGVALQHGSEFSLWTGFDTRGLHHCAASPLLDEIACQRDQDVIVLGPKGTESE